MKKPLFLSLLFCISVVKAQVFYTNFDSGIPSEMTQEFHNGTHSWGTTSGLAFFQNINSNGLSTSLITPEMDLSNGSYELVFDLEQVAFQNTVTELYVEISTNGGLNWSLIEEYTATSGFGAMATVMFDLTPFNPTSQTKIRFRGISYYAYAVILDNLVIRENLPNDAQLASVDLVDKSIMPQGLIGISGTIKNEGTDVITSIEINWQVDEGLTYSDLITGLSLNPGDTMTFTHEDQWDAQTSGDSPTPFNEVKVWISEINNSTAFNDYNTEIVKEIRIASGAVDILPLYEKFTSSTCPPCATFNSTYFNPHMNTNQDNVALINYQVNWPPSSGYPNGDPYYTAEVGARVNYYGINAAPSLLLNGVENTPFNSAVLQANLDAELQKFGGFEINGEAAIQGDNVVIDLEIEPYLSGQFRVHVVVVESLTTGNAATNGETSFHNVMMKMVPNAQGTTVEFEIGNTFVETVTASLQNTNIEEMHDLSVLVFIQDMSTKYVLQTNFLDYTLTTGGYEKLTASVYPNPTSGIVQVQIEEDLTLKVLDVTGKIVYKSELQSGINTVDMSHLAKGLYLMNMSDGQNVITKKIILK